MPNKMKTTLKKFAVGQGVRVAGGKSPKILLLKVLKNIGTDLVEKFK